LPRRVPQYAREAALPPRVRVVVFGVLVDPREDLREFQVPVEEVVALDQTVELPGLLRGEGSACLFELPHGFGGDGGGGVGALRPGEPRTPGVRVPLAGLLLRGRLRLTPLPCLLAGASQARFGGPVDPAGPFGEFHVAGEALTSGEHADLPG